MLFRSFPEKVLAAVGVAFLLIIELRRVMRMMGRFQGRPEPRPDRYLDLVALGTVADVAPLSGLNRAFFSNSGAEAVEACLKFARRFWYTAGLRDRTEFVAISGAFAGRTFGALSVTHDEHYRTPFEPLVQTVRWVDPDDVAGLTAAVTSRTAAVIAEPIQGEGGIRPLSSRFAQAISEVCERTGTLLIADEVQTGLGRTGAPFRFQTIGWKPDLVSVGKALGGGVPVGAVLLSERVAKAISYGEIGRAHV